MAIVPVFCDSCGSVWGAPHVIGGSGARVEITGSKAGPCPVCGGMGSIPDGVYDLIGDILTVSAAEQIAPQSLQAVIGLLEAAARGELTPTEALEQTEAQAPALAGVIGSYLERADPLSWIALIVAILQMLLAPQPPTAEEIAKELRRKPIPVRAAPVRKAGAARATEAKAKRRAKSYGKNKKRRSRKRR